MRTITYQTILDGVYGLTFICILIILHCLIRYYFKHHTDDSEKPYISKLKTYYIAISITFPTVLVGIIENLVVKPDSETTVWYNIMKSFQVLLIELLLLTVSIVYCFDWPLLKEVFISKQEEERDTINEDDNLLTSI